jgi:hypothetical protein
MAIGYIKSPALNYSLHRDNLHKIKLKYKTPVELKWEKASASRMDMYEELIDYFFKSDLQFRCVLVKYKENLDHAKFNEGSHEVFYYKTIYYLITNTYFNPNDKNEYHVFLDISNTRGRDRKRKILEVLSKLYKGNNPFTYFQHIRSHETPLLQLADFFLGAVSYKARLMKGEIQNPSPVKLKIIKRIEQLSGYSLDESSEPWDTKFNVFDHQPKKSV